MYIIEKPALELRPYIENYWSVRPKVGELTDITVNVFVDARADLIYNFGVPYFRQRIGGKSISQSESNLDAQRNYPISIRQMGKIDIVGVRFYTGGLGAFCHSPMIKLTNRTVPLVDAFGNSGIELHHRLFDVRHSTTDLKSVLDDFFLQCLIEDLSFNRFIDIKNHIEVREGLEPVTQTCNQFGISNRNLDRLFSKYMGFSPKYFARIRRFQKSMGLLMENDSISILNVAMACGYYDQSHFVKDFAKFTGGVPRGYKGYYPPQGPKDFAPNVVHFLQDTTL